MIYKLKLHIYFITLFIAIIPLTLVSRNFDGDENEIEYLDSRKGLSQNTINSIYQDSLGFMWIGTADGLNRYDGYEVKIYRYNPEDTTSISNNYINTIFKDKKFGFWIGTDNGLDYYDIKRDKFIRYLSGLNIRVISGVSVGNDNIVFLSITKFGERLYNFNLKSRILKDITIKEDDIPVNLIKLKKDLLEEVWAVSKNAIYKILDSTGKTEKKSFKTPDRTAISDFIFSKDNRIFVSTPRDIFCLNKDCIVDEIITFPSYVSGNSLITVDKQNNIWIIGSNTTGMIYYNMEAKQFKRYFESNSTNPLNGKIIKTKRTDKSGILWIGTDGRGVIRYNPNARKFKLISHNPYDSNSLSINFPKGLMKDSHNNLWVTTVQGGLNKFNTKSRIWEHFTTDKLNNYHISSNNGYYVFEDSEHTIWYGGSNSIDTFNLSGNKFIPVYAETGSQVIFEDSSGFIWTGSTNKILIRHNKKTGESNSIFELVKNPNLFNALIVYCIAQTDQNNLWFGTDNGLYNLNTKNLMLKLFKNILNDKTSLSNDYVISLLADSKGRLWAGTRFGINIYNKEKNNFYRFNQAEGLPNSFIYGIVEDKNSDYWISTNNGLSKLKFNNINDYKFRNFNLSDGVQSNEFNTNSYCKSPDGFLYFGGVGGINYFHPDSLNDNKNVPKVVITKINLFDMPYKSDLNYSFLKILKLPYFNNTLSFEFSALEFTEPSLNKYAYYMEGIDTGWVYSGDRRFARYANLKPGKYKFRVKASNNDNIWNNEGTNIVIYISQPFWSAIEFRIFIIVILIIFIILLFRFRTNQIRQRNAFLEKQIEIRTEELRNKNELLQAKTEEISLINESLEKRVEERTLQLQAANTQLQDVLNEITNSKSESLKAIIRTQEDERSRFAKDLHDGAGQYLAFLKFNINNIISKLDSNSQFLKDNLMEQVKLIDNIVKELRQFAYSLMPPVLERIGLKAALEELLENFKTSTNIKFEYYLQDKKKPLPKYYRIHLYRAVQEVLSNAVKHSQCSKIYVQLLSYPNNILIIIEDNGIGFNINSEKTGMGLKNLSSRIALINGKLDIDSQLNHGTTITIEVPQ